MSFGMDRRNLLKTSAALGVTVAAGACKKDEAPEPAGAASAPETSTLEVLTAVAARILPSDGEGPGAKEADVGAFLVKALDDVRLAHLRPLLERGAAFLDEAARSLPEEPKAANFSTLSAARQDELLDRLANRKMRPSGFDGTAFVRILVALTLEGFLGDPRHGGNRDQVAWTWLGFDPQGRNAVQHASAHGGQK